jgi:hypothetical protein
MSAGNGDHARLQKKDTRPISHRERVHALVVIVRKRARELSSRVASRAASLDMLDEGGPLRKGD